MFFQQLYLEYLIPAIYTLVIALVGFFISLRIYDKFRVRRNRPLLYLSAAYFFYTFTVFTIDLGYFYRLFFGIPSEPPFLISVWIRWSIPLSMFLFGNYFHLCFAQEFFLDANKLHRAILGLFSLIVMVFFFLLDLTIDILELKYALILILSVPVQLYMMVSAFRAWKDCSDPVYIRRYKLIFLSVLVLPFIFIFFGLDNITGVYGPFFYLSWFMTLLSAIASYYGYVPPSNGE